MLNTDSGQELGLKLWSWFRDYCGDLSELSPQGLMTLNSA